MDKIRLVLQNQFVSIVTNNFTYNKLKKYIREDSSPEVKIVLIHTVFLLWDREKTGRFLRIQQKFYCEFSPVINRILTQLNEENGHTQQAVISIIPPTGNI